MTTDLLDASREEVTRVDNEKPLMDLTKEGHRMTAALRRFREGLLTTLDHVGKGTDSHAVVEAITEAFDESLGEFVK